MHAYQEFLRSKMIVAPERGLAIAPGAINPLLKPHQAAIVHWALRKGNAAIFAAFGLGKTFMQLEIARLIQQEAGGKFLIVAPLGVRQEFRRDAEKLGIAIQFVRRFEECQADGIFLTNYETIRDSKMDPRRFAGCSLDEAAILRGFGGTKTFREFMRVFENGQVQYKFVATATPSPNEYIELLAYAAFLDVMDVSQAKTRFFKRDSTKADNLTLHEHKRREFWLWISSWAIFLQKPSDLNFSDDGYDLPPLEICWHELPSDHTQAGYETSGQGRLVRSSAVGITHAAREKRDSVMARVERMVEIVCQQRISAELSQDALSRSEAMVSSEQRQDSDGSRDMEGAQPRLLPTVLPSEQRETFSAGESGISEKQSQDQRAIQAMENAESGEVQSGAESPQPKASGQDHPSESGMVCGEQRSGRIVIAPQQTETLRHNSGTGCESTRVTAASLQDLSVHDDASSTRTKDDADDSRSGSRSQAEIFSRDAVSQMQRGAGSFSRQAGSLDSRRVLPAQFIVWCDRNDEQRAVDETFAQLGISYSSLYGSQEIDDREKLLQAWKDRETTAFVSKAVMYGAGVNLQQCSTAIFLGINFQFAAFLQAVKRIHRFLQSETVTIHLIYTEAEREVRRVLEEKWARHNELVAQMSAIIREYGLATNALEKEFSRSLGVERTEATGENWKMAHNDAVLETASMADSSVHLIISSIPFSTQYEYSPSYNDFGHSESNEQFWEQMDFLIPELYRVLEPGRNCLIHVKDRVIPGGLSGLGFQTIYPFHCDAIRHFCRHGFGFMGQVTIVTDVVRENGQTYRLGWSEQCKDGSKMGWGLPEYLLGFRKPPTDSSRGYADRPVVKEKAAYSRHRWQIDAHGFHRSSGERLLTRDDIRGMPHERIFKLFRKHSLENIYDFEEHVGLGEALEVCAHCGHIHLGIRGDDDEGKVCGTALPSEWVKCPRCGGPDGAYSIPAPGGGKPCPDCFNDGLLNQGFIEQKLTCQCPRYDSALPKNFMLLQPQSWHPDVWTDITRMLSLNSAQAAKGKEMHLCPMQFDLADRAIAQFSMKGETVYDPFAGLGTVPLRAIKLGRKGIGCELAASYFRDACFYLEAAERQMATPTLFDLLAASEPVEMSETA